MGLPGERAPVVRGVLRPLRLLPYALPRRVRPRRSPHANGSSAPSTRSSFSAAATRSRSPSIRCDRAAGAPRRRCSASRSRSAAPSSRSRATSTSIHFREGIYPGGRSAFFEHDNVQGLGLFYTLYFAMTGLHALHVAVGMGVLTVILVRVARGTIAYPAGHAIENRGRLLAPHRRHLDLPLAPLLPHPGRSLVTRTSARTLSWTWLALLVLAGASFALSYAHLGGAGVPVALGIAAVEQRSSCSCSWSCRASPSPCASRSWRACCSSCSCSASRSGTC